MQHFNTHGKDNSNNEALTLFVLPPWNGSSKLLDGRGYVDIYVTVHTNRSHIVQSANKNDYLTSMNKYPFTLQ